MAFDIVDAYENIKTLTEKAEVAEASNAFLYKCMQELDKIVIAGGKPSVIKKVQEEFDKKAQETTTEEEIEEDTEDVFDELEAESVKKEKKKGRPSRIRPQL